MTVFFSKLNYELFISKHRPYTKNIVDSYISIASPPPFSQLIIEPRHLMQAFYTELHFDTFFYFYFGGEVLSTAHSVAQARDELVILLPQPPK